MQIGRQNENEATRPQNDVAPNENLLFTQQNKGNLTELSSHKNMKEPCFEEQLHHAQNSSCTILAVCHTQR